MYRFLFLVAFVLPSISFAQKIADASAIFDCTYKSPLDKKASAAAELCADLLEGTTKDKGTLLVRAEIIRLLNAGYFPVSDLQIKSVGPDIGYSVRHVQGYVEFSRDFKKRSESEIVVVSFSGFLTWNQDGSWFYLDTPKKQRLSQVELSLK